jgi:tRNA(Ile)-lysidine synthase
MGASRIVRPLIECKRDAVEQFLNDRGIAFRHDPSNVDRRFLRNRIRHDLLPLLEREYNPRVRNALVRLATIARDDSTVLRELLHKVLDRCTDDEGIHRETFAAESEALQRRVLQLVAQRYGVDLTFARTESARRFVLEGRTGAKLELGGATLINTRTTTRIQREYPTETGGTMPVPGEIVAFGRRFLAQALEDRPTATWAEYCSPSRQVFDADILGDAVRIRARQPGDRFTPLGMTGTRKLQDYFVDAGTPQDERDRVPIVEAGGRVAWVVGGAVDAAFAVGDATRRVMELNVTDATE